jgi:hypothetical protein
MKIIITEQQLIHLNRRIISEQVDSDDEERDLMQLWYGDDEDEYRDDYSFEKPYDNYRDDSDIESDDYYDVKNRERVDNTMRRSVEMGKGTETDSERRKGYTIDGHEYFLTPIEYRRKLKDMGRISPEKAFTYDLDVDDNGKMVVKKEKGKNQTPDSPLYTGPSNSEMNDIRSLKNKIRRTMMDINRTQEFLDKYRNTMKDGTRNQQNDYREYEDRMKTQNYSLNNLLAQYDELTGDDNGENVDF